MLLLTVSICDSAVGCVTAAEWLFLTSIHPFSVNCWRALSHADTRTRSGQVTSPFKGTSRDNLNRMREDTGREGLFKIPSRMDAICGTSQPSLRSAPVRRMKLHPDIAENYSTAAK